MAIARSPRPQHHPGHNRLLYSESVPFQQLLAAMDQHSQTQLLQALQVFQVDMQDSHMMMLFSHAAIAQALTEAPDKIKAAIREVFQDGLIGKNTSAQSNDPTLPIK